MQLLKFSRKERNLCKRISNIRNPWLNKPEHVQPEKGKPNLAKKFFGQEELQVFLTLERPTSRKYYIVHTPFQFFMKSETNILEKFLQSLRSVSKYAYA